MRTALSDIMLSSSSTLTAPAPTSPLALSPATAPNESYGLRKPLAHVSPFAVARPVLPGTVPAIAAQTPTAQAAPSSAPLLLSPATASVIPQATAETAQGVPSVALLEVPSPATTPPVTENAVPVAVAPVAGPPVSPATTLGVPPTSPVVFPPYATIQALPPAQAPPPQAAPIPLASPFFSPYSTTQTLPSESIPTLPLTAFPTTPSAPTTNDDKHNPTPTPKQSPSSDKRGRKKGVTFKHVSNDEIRSWCLDYFSSSLPLRTFCQARQLEGKRGTINRMLKESGLMELKKAKEGSRQRAEAVLNEFLIRREEKMKNRVDQLTLARYGKKGDGTAAMTTTTTKSETRQKSNNQGRRKGESYKYNSNDHIRTWCIDFYTSSLPLRSFCKEKGMEGKRGTILRHFNWSGLTELKKNKASVEEAEITLDHYLTKRKQTMKGRLDNVPQDSNDSPAYPAPPQQQQQQQPTDLSSPPRPPRAITNRGRKKGVTYKFATNDEIRTWCLDFFTSPLPLRTFCHIRKLEGKRGSINRHFKDSGLTKLKKANRSVNEADVVLTRYLYKREAIMKARKNKMIEGRTKMLEMREDKKREDEARAVASVEREKWLREEYRNMCAVFARGDMWTFGKFRDFCKKVEDPFSVTHNGVEVLSEVSVVIKCLPQDSEEREEGIEEKGEEELNDDEGNEEQDKQEEEEEDEDQNEEQKEVDDENEENGNNQQQTSLHSDWENDVMRWKMEI